MKILNHIRNQLVMSAPSPKIKVWLLRSFGATVGNNVTIYPGVRFVGIEYGFNKLHIDDNVSIGSNCLLDLSGRLEIDNRVVISPNVTIMTHFEISKGNILADTYPKISKGVVISDDVFIGTGATILDGSFIESTSIVGAMALLNGKHYKRGLIVGIPAEVKEWL